MRTYPRINNTFQTTALCTSPIPVVLCPVSATFLDAGQELHAIDTHLFSLKSLGYFRVLFEWFFRFRNIRSVERFLWLFLYMRLPEAGRRQSRVVVVPNSSRDVILLRYGKHFSQSRQHEFIPVLIARELRVVLNRCEYEGDISRSKTYHQVS